MSRFLVFVLSLAFALKQSSKLAYALFAPAHACSATHVAGDEINQDVSEGLVPLIALNSDGNLQNNNASCFGGKHVVLGYRRVNVYVADGEIQAGETGILLGYGIDHLCFCGSYYSLLIQ